MLSKANGRRGAGTHHHGRGATGWTGPRPRSTEAAPAQPNQDPTTGPESTAREDEAGHGRASHPGRFRG